jgi:2-polyprenyl-3-methyl-5-hydroxy-6-metoxy-1,4-benzoquinol methylase
MTTMTAKDHYTHHLAHFYSWMVGDFLEKQQAQEAFLVRNGIVPGLQKLAIDLGAGNGLQSVSLARLGFEVTAVDFNRQLLDELIINKEDLNVNVVCDEMMNFLKNFDGNSEAIVCMGDTITHLETKNHVEGLVAKISDRLLPGGKLVLSFRELMTELRGPERFIPVRSDNTRILMCFLEYFPHHVIVHDILYEFHSGEWIQKVSSYPKLRLSESYITRLVEESNIKVLSIERLSGMIYLVGEKAN